MTKAKGSGKFEYALYKGDTFLMIGTMDQLAEHYNVSRHTAEFWASPANIKRKTDIEFTGRKVAYKVEAGEDE